MTRASLRHVFADGARGMADTKLDPQLFIDLVLDPSWIVAAHASDKFDVLWWDSWPSSTPRAGLPSPVQLESLPVPGEHSLGLHDDERRGPAAPHPREPDPKDAIKGPKAEALGGTLVRSELLT